MRPGDLVRQWVEERLDAARQGIDTPDTAKQLTAQLAELAERVASLESAAGLTARAQAPTELEPEAKASLEPERAEARVELQEPEEPEAELVSKGDPSAADAAASTAASRTRGKRVAASPSGPRVALHDEMIAVLSERGPLSAGELAAAVAERGRYQPPRSGKPLDAAMVSQRVSNPVYRSRFIRNDGRIGLAEPGQ
jgi:hypothetical protein